MSAELHAGTLALLARRLLRPGERIEPEDFAAKVAEAWNYSTGYLRRQLQAHPDRAEMRGELEALIRAAEDGAPAPRLSDRTEAALAGRAARLAVEITFSRNWTRDRQALLDAAFCARDLLARPPREIAPGRGRGRYEASRAHVTAAFVGDLEGALVRALGPDRARELARQTAAELVRMAAGDVFVEHPPPPLLADPADLNPICSGRGPRKAGKNLRYGH